MEVNNTKLAKYQASSPADKYLLDVSNELLSACEGDTYKVRRAIGYIMSSVAPTTVDMIKTDLGFGKKTDAAEEENKIADSLRVLYDLCVFGESLYYRPTPFCISVAEEYSKKFGFVREYFSSGDPTDNVYKKLSDADLGRCLRISAQSVLGIKRTSRNFEGAATQVKKSPAIKKVGQKDIKRYTLVGNELIWDTEAGKMEKIKKEKIFKRLFDGMAGDDISIDITGLSDEVIQFAYDTTMDLLEENQGDLPTPYDDEGNVVEELDILQKAIQPFWEWADYSTDTFNDLIRLSATPLLKNKPNYMVFLIGKGANGKSKYIDLLHILYGANNAARVPIEEYDNWDYNNCLETAMINAPDEVGVWDDKAIAKNARNIKIAATHGDLEVAVKRGDSKGFKADFMSIFPLNELPTFSSGGEFAFGRRFAVIHFLHSFAPNGRGDDFEARTYTPEFFQTLVGIVLAEAAYMSKHGVKQSDTMKSNTAGVKDSMASVNAYLDRFFKYFGGVKSLSLIKKDYDLYKNEEDKTMRLAEFSKNFYVYTNNIQKKRYAPMGDNLGTNKAYWNRGASQTIEELFYGDRKMITVIPPEFGLTKKDLIERYSIDENTTIDDYLNTLDKDGKERISIVALLENISEVREAKQEQQKLNLKEK